MLPHVMRFNADATPDAMSAIADAMGGAHPAPEAVAALVASLPVPRRLRDAGVPKAVLDSASAEAAGNKTIQANPKPVTEGDLRELLQAAW
jgi:alcohol dehydrogenase class IV